ncbi:zinc finger protein 782-like [Microplitis mediator]|uniref:zinc finger protein 782-like n=1 Tax=Microplitis mediator TaxID=375433 RepID=UPI00255394B6|nr:zinc finger protein 782-like [Microplitis mediator]
MLQLLLNSGSILNINYFDQSVVKKINNSSDSNLITAIIKFSKLRNKSNETQPPKLNTDDRNHLAVNNKSHKICCIEYVCHECHKLFISAEKYNEHVLINHKNRKCLKSDGFNKEANKKLNFQNPLEEKKIYKHPCPHCTHTSKTMSALKMHLTSHSDERPYQCPHCNHTFKIKYHLKYHLRIHSSYRPYKCPNCAYESVRLCDLKCHLRVHTSEKNKIYTLECLFCPEKFSDRYSLMLHKKVHKKGRRYYCTECSYSVSQANNAKNHFEKKHIGERK